MSESAASILLPLLNQEDGYLEQSLHSAVGQTVPCTVLVALSPKTRRSNREIVARFAEGFPQVRVLEQRRPGFPAALNEAIEQTRTSRFGFLLSDDWLEPDAVEQSLRHSADIVSGQMDTYAADGLTPVPRPWKRITQARCDAKRNLEQKAAYLQHFFLLRRSKVLEAGGLDESFGDTPGIDDFELIWTMLERGATAAVVEKVLYNYRDHTGERLTLRDCEQMVETMKRILRKHGWSGDRFNDALERHSMWFGRTMREVLSDRESLAQPLPGHDGLLPIENRRAIRGQGKADLTA